MAGLLLAIIEREIPDRLSSGLKELREASLRIGTFIEDAEQRQLNDEEVKGWLAVVKNLYCEVIDVLDEWRIVLTKLQEEKKGLLSSFSIRQFKIRRVTHARKMKIRELIENMNTLTHDSVILKLSMTTISRKEPELRALKSPVLSLRVICGRESERQEIIGFLMNSTEKASIVYLFLVGMGGSGKTTLAQLVYNSFEVTKHFDLMAWVSVSKEFDQVRILNEFIESLTGESYPRDEVELDLLIQRLRQAIRSKRFLFVLDNVWEDDHSKWEPLKEAFKVGAPGSVILITTRSELVTSIDRSNLTFQVGALSDYDTFALIRHLVSDTLTDGTEIESFEKRAIDIINRCQGLPLNVRAIVGFLSTKKTVGDWQEFLGEFEKFWPSEETILSVLNLGYCNFDPLLRQCMMYCSIFPESQPINVGKLIKLWMAQDYFNDTLSVEMETQGLHCFEELLRLAFFQDFVKDYKGNLLCNKASLFTDLIKRREEHECCIRHFDQHTDVESSSLSFEEARHWTLSITAQASLPMVFCNAEKVHTLMIIHEYSSIDPTILSNLFRHLKRIRALDLSRCLIRKLPKKIGKLLHLRYLDFSYNHNLKQLPEELCDLSLLQTLNLNGCDSLQKLPNGIGKLIRLRHLEILWTTSLGYLPKGIASLTSLRTLNRFFGTSDVNSKACNLGDLEKLSHLQGYISIDGLGSVTDVALAERASLKNKVHLLSMDLWFSGVGSDSQNGAALMGALQPPPNLESLAIFYYKGVSFPGWMEAAYQLRRLMLSDCSGCEILPPLGKLPLLETLEIRNMINLQKVGPELLGIELDSGDGGQLVSTVKSNSGDGGEEVTSSIRAGGRGKEIISDSSGGCEKVMSTTGSSSRNGGNVAFPKLKELKFYNLKNWLKWDEITRIGENVTIMPELSYLSIIKCPMIGSVPDYIKSKDLRRYIAECPLLEDEMPEEKPDWTKRRDKVLWLS